MKQQKRFGSVVAVLFLLGGLLAAFYPFLSNWTFEHRADSQITVYEQKADEASAVEKQRLLDEAKAYNESLLDTSVQLTLPFVAEERRETVGDYENLLSISDTGIMGYVEIPAIEIYLPIYHGTNIATLEHGVGHLEGSSLPVGGVNTHTALTGHSGLSGARMFTDLDRLAVGDCFFLHVLGDVYGYRVDQIRTVIPSDTSPLLIVPGEDHATLITCTPYGINSHRLMVRGIRMSEEEIKSLQQHTEQEHSEPITEQKGSTWMEEYRNAMLTGVLIVAVMILVFLLIERRKR